MRRIRPLLWSIIMMLVLSVASVSFAQEATAEPEATQPVVDASPEVTQEPTAELTQEAIPTPTTPAEGTTYVVRVGDNLFRIALRNGLTTNELAVANGITNPSLIFVGQELVIPTAGTTPIPPATPSPEATLVPEATSDATPEATPVATTTPEPVESGATYVVRAGDTLYRIAVNNGTTVATLVSLNNIANANLIFTGQTLNLPAEGEAQSSQSDTPNTSDTDEDMANTDAGIEDLMFERGITVFLEGQDVDALVSQVTQLGFSWVRVVVNWRELGANETTDFALLDEGVQKFSAAGINILLTVTGAPDSARPSATEFVLGLQSDYGPPDDPATYATFVSNLAERYDGSVQAYEIWSEPNLRRTWISANVTGREDARMSDLRYIDLLTAAYEAIKAVNSDILVITGGLAPTGLNDRINAIDDRVFLSALIEQGVQDVSDGIGVQPAGFANAPDAMCCDAGEGVDTHYENERFYFMETLMAYREILTDNDASDLPMFVTRFGWGTAEGNTLATPSADVPYFNYTDLGEQATYIPSAFDTGAETGYIGGMFLYNLNGCQVGDAEACYYSLIDGNNAARPVFEALQALNTQ
jgi:LysM repeat protein